MDGGVQGSIALTRRKLLDLVLELVEGFESNGSSSHANLVCWSSKLYFDRYIKILAPNVDVMSDLRSRLVAKIEVERREVNGE
jgi:aarF domain-containing kinase